MMRKLGGLYMYKKLFCHPLFFYIEHARAVILCLHLKKNLRPPNCHSERSEGPPLPPHCHSEASEEPCL